LRAKKKQARNSRLGVGARNNWKMQEGNKSRYCKTPKTENDVGGEGRCVKDKKSMKSKR
jgi:hypothetical protein